MTTSGLLVAHAGLDAGLWAGSRPGGGVKCGGAMEPWGRRSSPGSWDSRPPQPLPHSPGLCCTGSAAGYVEMGEIKEPPALARNNAKSLAFGKDSEVCSGSAERAHTGPSPLACV